MRSTSACLGPQRNRGLCIDGKLYEGMMKIDEELRPFYFRVKLGSHRLLVRRETWRRSGQNLK